MDAQKTFPLEIKDIEPELIKERVVHGLEECTDFVRVGPKGYFLPRKFRHEAANIYHMPLRPDDIFVASFPRSGTTWTQELVWMLANDLDYARSKAIFLTERYTFLEFLSFIPSKEIERLTKVHSHSEANLELLKKETEPRWQRVARVPSPRFIKTHLPLSLLPPALLDSTKMVYVARDPRDVAVSFYHLNWNIKTRGSEGDFKTHWNYFMRDFNYYAPYFEQLKEAWEKREHPNMLFLFYEELIKDLPAAVRRVAKFLNKEFTSEQIAKLCDHLSINNFKNNKSVHISSDNWKKLGFPSFDSFIRKGKAGGWRDYFDEEMSAEAEQWIASNLKDTDLRFPHIQ